MWYCNNRCVVCVKQYKVFYTVHLYWMRPNIIILVRWYLIILYFFVCIYYNYRLPTDVGDTENDNINLGNAFINIIIINHCERVLNIKNHIVFIIIFKLSSNIRYTYNMLSVK